MIDIKITLRRDYPKWIRRNKNQAMLSKNNQFGRAIRSKKDDWSVNLLL
jgi:hypothetical protein